jgi:hypothetical protein
MQIKYFASKIQIFFLYYVVKGSLGVPLCKELCFFAHNSYTSFARSCDYMPKYADFSRLKMSEFIRKKIET